MIKLNEMKNNLLFYLLYCIGFSLEIEIIMNTTNSTNQLSTKSETPNTQNHENMKSNPKSNSSMKSNTKIKTKPNTKSITTGSSVFVKSLKAEVDYIFSEYFHAELSDIDKYNDNMLNFEMVKFDDGYVDEFSGKRR